MRTTLHRVRSLRWQVGADTVAEAFSCRTLLHEKGTDMVLPLLLQGFDEAAPGEQVIHIPRITLHVRVDTMEELATALPDLLVQLKEQLSQNPGTPDADVSPAAEAATGYDHFAILLHYLQTGLLPWQEADAPMAELAATLCNTCLEAWPRLLGHLKNTGESPLFYFRLLQLLPETACVQLIRDISGDILDEPRETAMKCLALLLDDACGGLSNFTRLHLMAGILAECAGGHTHCPSALHYAATVAKPHEHHLLNHFAALLATATSPPPVADHGDRAGTTAPPVPSAPSPSHPHSDRTKLDPLHPLRRSAAGIAPLGTDAAASTRTEPQAGRGNGSPIRGGHPGTASLPGDTASAPVSATPGHRPGITATDELYPLLVRQVGLIMLHPYIGRIFDNCDIKDTGNSELFPAELPRAAALLHFLSSGRDEPYEYELGLIKVLLGLRPDTPLPVCSGLLTSNDREEADSLLSAVIRHWDILKQTSINSLRSSFLERQGLLRQGDDGWRLNVERKPYDILVDRIPWSIAIVRLPWMQQAIFTEW